MDRTVFKRRKPDDPTAADTDHPPDKVIGATPEGARRDVPASRPTDSGLGVPPFRPASPKEPSAMGRSPFPGSPAPVPAPPPPAPIPVAPARPHVAGRQSAERRTLVVGRGISVQGVVQDAERLVVEGTVESTMIHAAELAVAQGGVFRGEVEVEDAEIGGTVDGTLTARGSLSIRATGKLLGTARCRRLQVEDGGQITGRIEMILEPAEAAAATPAPASTAARPAEPAA
jgi:cytoskeletal protein CcmA (bactofilin family)